MTSQLTCLVYASRRPPAAPTDQDGEVRDILIASMNNNRMAAISGLLITHAGWFLQALEGPAEAVEAAFKRIGRDPRHFGAQTLTTRAAPVRRFPRWTMCAQSMSTADVAILHRLVGDGSFDPFTCEAETALTLLTTVADLHGQLLSNRYAELEGELLAAD